MARIILLAGIGFSIFAGTFYYEGNFAPTVISERLHHLVLHTGVGEKTRINRAGSSVDLPDGEILQVADIVETQAQRDVTIDFAVDGQLRLDQGTRLLINSADEDRQRFSFKLLEGRVWMVNSYSNADVNLLVDGAAVIPGQSVIYATARDGRADIYANAVDAVVGFLSVDHAGTEVLDEHNEAIINGLYLPQGTMVTVYANKIAENESTIAKLLFSKLVKEFNYSVFDKQQVLSDEFLSQNVLADARLRAKIREERLRKIQKRGLKYSSLEASNYHIDLTIRELANLMTLSADKVAVRNLEALYDFLYDAQYLFDYGRKMEAEERLSVFAASANQLFLIYGPELKQAYIDRIRNEYEYLSFADPTDSLFGLKQVLRELYLDSIQGQPEELETRFGFLKEDLNTMVFYAENEQGKDLQTAFKVYTDNIKRLLTDNEKVMSTNLVYLQRQNQALDNLFSEYPAFYRQEFFTSKLFLENKYLSLLPAASDKMEEVQSVISRRIDFLRHLQQFYLDGKVPLSDTQNILALIFSEISRIELPTDYQVAVKKLFSERLEDYGVFNRFLNSQEYVSSSLKGATPRERFAQFKADNTQMITVEALQAEFQSQVSSGGTDNVLGDLFLQSDPNEAQSSADQGARINEELVTTNIDGAVTTSENQLDTSSNDTPKVKVPRVKPAA